MYRSYFFLFLSLLSVIYTDIFFNHYITAFILTQKNYFYSNENLSRIITWKSCIKKTRKTNGPKTDPKTPL